MVFVISYLPLNLRCILFFMLVISSFSYVSVYNPTMWNIPSKLSSNITSFTMMESVSSSIGMGCGTRCCTAYLFTINLMTGGAFEALICTCAICLKLKYMHLIVCYSNIFKEFTLFMHLGAHNFLQVLHAYLDVHPLHTLQQFETCFSFFWIINLHLHFARELM